MGYTTKFDGHVTVDPPLNGPEMDYLRRFADSRRYQCTAGPYHAVIDGDLNRHAGCMPIATSSEPAGQPGLWCSWVPTQDGSGIEWDGMEKFYNSAAWMRYLIDAFLESGAGLQWEMKDPIEGRVYDPAFQHFTFNHTVNGRIEAQGDSDDDRWTLVVVDNVVSEVMKPTLAERLNDDADLRAAFKRLMEAGVTVGQYARMTGQDY